VDKQTGVVMVCHKRNGYRFSVTTKTIFEDTKIALNLWFKVGYLMLTSKKGMSALQIQRYMGFGSYKTAWEMCHKVRTALIEAPEKLGGIVEVDETFIGGLAKNRHKDKRGDGSGGTGGAGKAIVAGAVKRKGNVIARVVANVQADTLTAFIREAVSDRVSLLCTDQWVGYKHLHEDFRTRQSTMRAVNMSSARFTRIRLKVSGR
ncbi:MAG: IS1595 family transposase, partial [Methylovirgula sp.]